MRFRSTAPILTSLFALATGLQAQTIVHDSIDNRIEALNAVFAFRGDLGRDGTVIARCRIPSANPDSGAVPGLEARFVALLVRPDTVQTRGDRRCGVAGFADRKCHVLWLEDIVEIRKISSGMLPAYRSIQFEIAFQFLKGPGYREFQRYVVEPSGIASVRPGSSESKISGWRVMEYRLVGWDFHWGDNLGHGSGVRLP